MTAPIDAFPRAPRRLDSVARDAVAWEAGLAWVLYTLQLARVIGGHAPYLGTGVMEALLAFTLLSGPLLHGTREPALGIGHVKEWKARLLPVPRHESARELVLFITMHAIVLFLHVVRFDWIYLLLPGIGFVNGWLVTNAPGLVLIAGIAEFVFLHLIARPLLAKPANMRRAVARAGKPMIPFVAGLLAWSAVSGFTFTPVDPLAVVATWYGYVFWAAIQQLPFLWYFANRFAEAMPAGRAWDATNALLVAIPFSLLHAPQWPLVLITLAMEWILAWCFVTGRARNLLAVAWYHALVGTVLVHFSGLYMMTYAT